MRLFLLITFISTSSFALPITQSAWVKEALATPEETLLQKGPYRCEHKFSSAAYFNVEPAKAYGVDSEMAQKNVFLLCIKKRCEGLNQEISAAQRDLQKLSDEDFSNYLKAWGQSEGQIQTALQARHHSLLPTPACQIASQIEAVFGGCYTAHLTVHCESVP